MQLLLKLQVHAPVGAEPRKFWEIARTHGNPFRFVLFQESVRSSFGPSPALLPQPIAGSTLGPSRNWEGLIPSKPRPGETCKT